MIHYNINPNRIIAIIMHFNGKMKPWNKNSHFYDEWSQNKDSINLELRSKNIFNIKIFYLKLFIFNNYSIFKKMTSLKIFFFIRHLLINYYPKIYMYFRGTLHK